MTSGETEPAGPRRSTRKRTLIIAAVAAIAAAGVLVGTLAFTPNGGTVDEAASTGRSNATSSSSSSPVSKSSTSAPTTTPLPERTGPRFDAWVDEVAGWLDIPKRAMHAYAAATVRLGEEQPDCHLSWVTLAGIGRTASDHGRAQGGHVAANGAMSTPIGTIEIKDFEGDSVSVAGSAGPMQLSPAVWQRWRAGADGAPDIQNLDDAALTAGRALCADGRNLENGQQWLDAVTSVHDAPLFLHRVLATANVYGTVGITDRKPDKAVLTAVNFAIEKIGLPYVWGGNGTENGDEGFDCSGLTTAAYARGEVELPRTAHWQYNAVPHVAPNEQPELGDLIFYGNPATKIHHVGIYIGNQQMIDAPTFGQAVQVHNYREPGDDFAGAGRPVA